MRSDLRTMSEINCQIATIGEVAFDDEIKLERKDKEAMEKSEKKRKDEYNEEATASSTKKEENISSLGKKEENIGSSTKKEENIGSSTKTEENRRKSSDFWLLWPEPSTRASMARFYLLLLALATHATHLYHANQTLHPMNATHATKKHTTIKTHVSRGPCYYHRH